MKESIKPIGHLTLVVKDKYGKVKQVVEKHNLVVTEGRRLLAFRLAALGAPSPWNEIKAVAIGDDNTLPAAGQVDLSNELFRGASANEANSEDGLPEGTARFITTFGPGLGNPTLRESGLFTDTTQGTAADFMFSRVIFGDITLDNDDIITATWDVSFT